MAFEGAARTAQTATGLIGILGGLLAAVAAFDGQVRGAVAVFARLGAPGLAASAAALLSLGLLLFVLGRRKASQLLDPDALRLDPRRPEHLIGRSEDVRLLHEKCVASRLVFLVGDSGAGKSALVRAGLAPAVETSGRLLAVHIDMANLDWDGDACEALADCFWRSLPTAARDALGASQPPAVADLPRLLAACYPTHGRTPLVVLDQIDDYQLRHRERFLPPASRSWIGAAQLIDTNRIWGMLAPLVRARHIHLLMITRSDNADGLESLRLVDNPIVARLDPLPAGFVLRVIDQLVARSSGAAPVVENPEAGWNRLRLRLAQDLEAGGTVLPQQLKVALLGLGRLGRLSVPNYERIGGVPGLEARYVADSLARAAARADLDAAAVRTALVRLVEPDGARRAPPLPASDLALGLPERDAARLGGALEALEEADILRRRQVGGIDASQLDHDHLARGILRIEADADRWRVMLARRAAEFADARGSLLARWRALLSTREQVAFLLARLRRRFRYGEHRWFAALSAAPYAAGLLVVGTALGIGYVAVGELAARTAWQAMPGGTAMSPGNRALTNVAEWPSFARRAFVRQLFEDPERAEHAAAWPEPVVRAVVGLDEDRAAEFARRIAAAAAVGKDNDAAVDAAAAMLPLLPASALRTVPEPLAAALAEARARGASLGSAALRALAADRRREVDASRALEPILEELTRGEPVDRVSLAEHQRFLAAMQLVRVGPGLGPEALAAAAERLHAALLAPDRRPSAAGPLLLGYALLARRRPPAGQERAAAALVGWTGAEDDEFRLAAANALQLLAVRMPTGVSSATARALLDGLRTAQGKVLRTRDGYFNLVVLLATSYAAAVPPSAERERAAAAAVVLDEMRAHRGDLWPVAFLADAHALLTLGAGASGGVQRADARATLLEALSTFSTSKRRAAVDAAEQPHTLLREVFLLCGSDGCARLFAAAVIDAAAGRPFDERAALLLELLKLPALAGMTNALLAQLRREDGAAAAGVPEGGLWQIVAWAKARGLDPGKPLDGERLLGALAP